MSKGVSVEKVNEAINACERERESRRQDFADQPDVRKDMVYEMNATLDVLRWAKGILTIGDNGEAGAHENGRTHSGRGRRR